MELFITEFFAGIGSAIVLGYLAVLISLAYNEVKGDGE